MVGSQGREETFQVSAVARTQVICSAFACIAGFLQPAFALEYEAHGFIAQGALLSSHNNLYGESSSGTIEYSEAGLNGAVEGGRGLRAAAQILTRRAGDNDDGAPRVDFAFLDWRPLRGQAANLGVRAGKVKNPWGLYNDSRDVVFTRPGILLPDSMYSDISGQRALLFSSEGGQLYADAQAGSQLLSLVVTRARNRRLGDSDKEKLIDLGGAPFDLTLRDYWLAQLVDGPDQGRWRLALSALHGDLDLNAPDAGITGEFRVVQYGLSAQYNDAGYTLTAELLRNYNVNDVYLGGSPLLHLEPVLTGGYLQGEYRVTPALIALARFDAMVQRTGGKGCAEQSPPLDPEQCYSYDTTLGGNWQPGPHWGVWAELHLIDGLFNRISIADNPSGSVDPHWNVFLLMAAYRF